MQVLHMPLPPAAVALNRFGLGARPDDVSPKDPKGWLRDQLEAYRARPPVIAALPNSEAIAIPYFHSRRQANTAGDAEAKQAIFAASRSEHRRLYRAAVNARIAFVGSSEIGAEHCTTGAIETRFASLLRGRKVRENRQV